MELLTTPLTDWHRENGARLAPFAGYAMPIQYRSIVDEASHVRVAAGLFDLCHMGRLRVRGRDAVRRLHALLTCDVEGLREFHVRYGLMTREDGTIIDDVLVYRLPDADGEPVLFLCVNAGNRARDVAWIRAHLSGSDAVLEDLTERMAMIAVQGPRSAAVARALCRDDPGALRYYQCMETEFEGAGATMVSRTGYTGEDGFEFFLPSEDAVTAWEKLLQAGEEAGLRPTGLGARDTLRLEAGMPLYGHEIDDSTTPLEAGLSRFVRPDPSFVGGAALSALSGRSLPRRLVGFVTSGKRIPRFGYPVVDGDSVVGDVRSGTWSPALQRSIGTAYVPEDRAAAGARLSVDCRGTKVPVEVVSLPFYDRRQKNPKTEECSP